ncbi:MAG: hypothetical protein MW689_000400 [Thermodesulfobacteria bacterium]|nr:hypothetical protein [Thermodesulfobacteriota bacterium]
MHCIDFLMTSFIADTAHVVFAKWQELSLSHMMKNHEKYKKYKIKI